MHKNLTFTRPDFKGALERALGSRRAAIAGLRDPGCSFLTRSELETVIERAIISYNTGTLDLPSTDPAGREPITVPVNVFAPHRAGRS